MARTKAQKDQDKVAKRNAAKKADKEAKAAKSASLVPKKGAARVQPAGGLCPCGCGQTLNGKSSFAMGHDARIKGWLVKNAKGKMSLDDKPAIVRDMAAQWKGQLVKELLQKILLASTK